MERTKSQPEVTYNPKRLEFPGFWIGHIPFAFFLTARLKPTIVVELGTHSGNSFFAFCQSVKENNIPVKCYAIDTWLGDEHSGFYYEDVYESIVNHVKEEYADIATLFRMKFDEAKDKFRDKSIDILNIDGLHTYDAVKHDFDNWFPKLSDKAVVLFHDTQIRRKGFGVWKFWAEISKLYPSCAFTHSCGLGIIAVGNNVPLEVLGLIQKIKIDKGFSQSFENHGKELKAKYRKLQLGRNLRKIFSLHIIIKRRLKREFS